MTTNGQEKKNEGGSAHKMSRYRRPRPLPSGALHKKSGEGELPALVKAGRLVQEINVLTNTTPALRATPPRLRRGAFVPIRTFCALRIGFLIRPFGPPSPEGRRTSRIEFDFMRKALQRTLPRHAWRGAFLNHHDLAAADVRQAVDLSARPADFNAVRGEAFSETEGEDVLVL